MNDNEISRLGDQGYHRNVMKIVAAVSLIATAGLGISTAAAGFYATAAGLFGGFLVIAVLLVMIWRGNFHWPRLLLPFVALLLTIYLLVVGDGVRDEGVLGLVLAITLASLLLGRRWVAAYTVAGVVTVIAVGLAQELGLILPDWEFGEIWISVIVLVLQIIFIGALVYITIGGLERALRTVHQREAELAQSNQALLEIQSALEDRIAERVRNLHLAREEAETARREVEQQAWLTNGLAQLGDVMGGEQTIPELASNVISFLCRYLDAPVGALFLWDGSQLELSGCFACTPGWEPVFALGEGLVGQSAQERQPLALTEIPPDAVRISTGLGESPPSQVVAVPFLFNQALIGVFEIGTVTGFSESHLAFLQSAAERIGVAFHTALAREKIDKLLEKTRQQAEELQRREEELQTINEELQAQVDHLNA